MDIGTVFSSLLAIVLALAVVLGLAWVVIWLLRKFQDGRLGAGDEAADARSLRFVRALPLGPRERLVLVETGGEFLLLGVTGAAITPVAHWDAQGRKIDEEAGTPRPRYSAAALAALNEKAGGPRHG